MPEASGTTAAQQGRTRKASTRTPERRGGIEAALPRLGLRSREDLRLHLPLRYEDETRLTPMAALRDGQTAQVEGVVVASEVQHRNRRILVATVADDSGGQLQLRLLHWYPSQRGQLEAGRRVRLLGEARCGLFGMEMLHPRIRNVEPGAALPERLTPVYPTVAGLSQTVLRSEIRAVLRERKWPDTMPPAILAEAGFDARITAAEALQQIHEPAADAELAALQSRQTPAFRRIAFEELVAQQLSLRLARARRDARPAVSLADDGAVQRLLAALPFSLTGAQQRAWAEIAADLAGARPMNRLLQGDVGSGKTIVAALAALRAVASGRQVAIMAPTEILARQHHEKLSAWFGPIGVEVGWLVGSVTAGARRALRQRMAADELRIVVGTHALISDETLFDRLALAIVDEQHRFGVAQRLSLRTRADGQVPHLLMMSATPIPRTLAMTFLADLDVSVIDELPPGRQPVTTKLFSDVRRDAVIEGIRAAVHKGRQVYWVCPLVEESEALDLQNAIDTHAALAQELHGLRVGLVHGRLSAADKAATMAAFSAGDIDVLVATTVIEVGVDVPNASLMVIEHAERFGLAQLHQLRGRIGRGEHRSVCCLLYRHPPGPAARERLATMYESSDGFVIAERDLQQRGPGDFLGARQSGLMLLRVADLDRDADLVERARLAADRMLQSGEAVVAEHLQRWLGAREGYLAA